MWRLMKQYLICFVTRYERVSFTFCAVRIQWHGRLSRLIVFVCFPLKSAWPPFSVFSLQCERRAGVFGIKVTTLAAADTVQNVSQGSAVHFSWVGQVEAGTSKVQGSKKVNPCVLPLVLAAPTPHSAPARQHSHPRHRLLGLPLCLDSAPPTPHTQQTSSLSSQNALGTRADL